LDTGRTVDRRHRGGLRRAKHPWSEQACASRSENLPPILRTGTDGRFHQCRIPRSRRTMHPGHIADPRTAHIRPPDSPAFSSVRDCDLHFWHRPAIIMQWTGSCGPPPPMIDVLFTVRRASASISRGASRCAGAPSDAAACRSAAHVAPPAIVLSRLRECLRPTFDAETAQLG